MAFSLKRLGERFFITLNVISIVFLALPGLIPYTNPAQWWWLGFLGLAFPYMLVIVFGFFVFWLIVHPKYALLPLFAMLLGWKQITVLFKIPRGSFDYTKTENTLRVLTWNVKIFEGIQKGAGSSAFASSEIISFIKAADADVVCLQEFNQYDSGDYDKNHIKRMLEAGYPYYLFSSDYKRPKVDYHSGVAIF